MRETKNRINSNYLVEYVNTNNLMLYSDFIQDIEPTNELAKSISEFGILNPLIARRFGQFYEVISGNVRLIIARMLKIKEVPIIVVRVNREEAALLYLECNIQENKIETLQHSQLARLISLYHKSIKCQGRRSDLIREVEELLFYYEESFRPMGEKLNSAGDVGKAFNLSPRTVSRYLCIDKLSDAMKNIVDKGMISLRAAVEVSYMDNIVQGYLAQYINLGGNVSYEIANAIRLKIYTSGNVNLEDIRQMLELHRIVNKSNKSCKRFPPMKKLFVKYKLFKYTPIEIESLIDKALSNYLSDREELNWYEY